MSKYLFIFYFTMSIVTTAFSKETLNLSSYEKKWIENNTVVIGINSWEPLKIVNSSKTSASGIDLDRLQLIIDRLGLKVEFQYDTFDNIMSKFKAQKIDLIPSTYFTNERAQFGLFSKPYLYIKEYLFVQEESKIKTFQDLKAKKLAIIKSYGTIEKIKKRYPSIQIVETQSLEESAGMVLDGEVDALFDLQIRVSNYVKNNFIRGLKGVAQTSFKASAIHLLSNKQKPVLQSILQKALDSITSEEEQTILKKWLTNNFISSTYNRLEDDELDFITKNKTIKMCNNPNWAPIEFKKDGEYAGIVIDTLSLIEKQLNIQFEVVPTKSWQESQEFLKRKKCDILPCAAKTLKREEYAVFTKPYLKLPLAIFTRRDSGLVSNLSEVIDKPWSRKKGSGVISAVKEKYPYTKVIETKDNTEALKLVSNGDAHFTIATLPIASYSIKSNLIDNLHIAGYTDIKFDLSMAVRDDKPILRDILDKALDEVSQKEHNEIFQSWVGATVKESVVDYKKYWQILFFISFVIIALIYRQWLLKQSNKKLQVLVDEKVKELNELNDNLLHKVEEEVERNRHNELQLLEQSKMAAMGDMVGNIAHQWRQPLSIISTASTGLIVRQEFGEEISKEELLKNLNMINDNAQYLSNTIDTFRDYIKEKKEYKEVVLQDRVKLALNIVQASLSNNYISLIHNLDEIEPIKIKIVVGELSEVFINILNNAKDILKERQIKEPWIKIELIKEQSKVILTVEDNAGGIPKEILPKIFDPYFTTKHQSVGTGLGLHISYKIVTESLGGKLLAKNSENGAKLFIELPLETL